MYIDFNFVKTVLKDYFAILALTLGSGLIGAIIGVISSPFITKVGQYEWIALSFTIFALIGFIVETSTSE